MSKYERILEALNNMDTSDVVSVWNEYCSATDNMDDYVYAMEEFDEIMHDSEPSEIARACFYGDFRPCDDYFRFNVYANIESFDSWEEDTSPISAEEIAEYCAENEDALYCTEIEEALDEDDEEEEGEDDDEKEEEEEEEA